MQLEYQVPDLDMEVSARVWVGQEARVRPVHLRYYRERPSSAVIYFVEEREYWEFGRQLLLDTVMQQGSAVGVGSVRLRSLRGSDTIRVWIMPPGHMFHFELPFADVSKFVRESYGLLGRASEFTMLGIDKALEEVFGEQHEHRWWRQACGCDGCTLRRLHREKGTT